MSICQPLAPATHRAGNVDRAAGSAAPSGVTTTSNRVTDGGVGPAGLAVTVRLTGDAGRCRVPSSLTVYCTVPMVTEVVSTRGWAAAGSPGGGSGPQPAASAPITTTKQRVAAY